MGGKIVLIFICFTSILVVPADSFYRPPFNFNVVLSRDDNFINTLENMFSIEDSEITCDDLHFGSPKWMDKKCWKQRGRNIDLRAFKWY